MVRANGAQLGDLASHFTLSTVGLDGPDDVVEEVLHVHNRWFSTSTM